MSIAKYTR